MIVPDFRGNLRASALTRAPLRGFCRASRAGDLRPGRRCGSILPEAMNPCIIQVFEVSAIVVAGTMTGNEIAVAVFFHPRISRLEDAVHIRTAQTLASVLGAVMPFWYALTFLLSLAVTFIAHTTWSNSWWLALGSTVLWAAMIIYSVLLPVPINNQVARWQPDSLPANWRELRRRWDMLHAIRVCFLIIALILLVTSSVIRLAA